MPKKRKTTVRLPRILGDVAFQRYEKAQAAQAEVVGDNPDEPNHCWIRFDVWVGRPPREACKPATGIKAGSVLLQEALARKIDDHVVLWIRLDRDETTDAITMLDSVPELHKLRAELVELLPGMSPLSVQSKTKLSKRKAA